MKLLTAAEMREVDRRAVEEVGIPVAALMENAGRAVADALEEALPDLDRRSLLVVCGRGHNGGDGLVAARHLAGRGHAPQVLLLGRVDALRSDLVRAHARALPRMGVPVAEAATPADLAGGEGPGIGDFDVIVDAVTGTGFTPPARELEARAIEAMAQASEAGAFVLAVDLPSGLDASSARVEGASVPADVTVTFAAPKLAHALLPAAERCGRLVVADISVPAFLVEQEAHRVELVGRELAAALVPPRPPGAHKGTFGHLLVVAGSLGKTGAAVLVARAALRAGVGLVTVATPRSCLPLVAAGCAEAMTEPLPEDDAGGLAPAALERLLALLETRDALAVGPGLGHAAATAEVARALLARARVPAVADADALNAHAGALDALAAAGGARPLVLTPHPGEAARLLGTKTAEVTEDRLGAVRELARRAGATALLKGSRTLVADAAGSVWVNTTGNPGLATAGTGDALTGIVGALLAQRLPATPAAVLGAWLHGLAADAAAGEKGEASLVAGDVIEALPAAFRAVAEEGEDVHEEEEEDR